MVKILLTEKWIECVPYLQLSCISLALMPIHTANLQAINAIGRSDIFLKLEILKKIVGLTFLVIGIPYGVYIMVVLKVVTSFVSSFINAFPNKKLLNYSYLEQIRDIIPSLFISLIMGVCVLSVNYLSLSSVITLIIQIPLGAFIYVALAKIFKLECFEYLLNMVKKK